MKPTRILSEAVEQGYVVMRDSYTVSNLYWHYCVKNKIPFVRIRLKSVFAVVTVDMDSTDEMRMTSSGALKINSIMREYNCRKGRESFTVPQHGSMYEYATKIPIADAAEVARKCIDVLDEEGSQYDRRVDFK